MRQTTFIDPPRSRRDDPTTSSAAAESMRTVAGDHHRIILAVLRASRRPLCADEIARHTPLGPVQVNRRLAELRRAGMVVVVDSAGTTRSGRAAQRYRAAGDGR